MNKFKVFKGDSLYDLEIKVNRFLSENLCNKLNQNNERITDLERIIFNFKEIRKGAMYE